jgi:hypothetical protein
MTTTTTIQTSSDPAALYFIPTEAWIAGLQVGDMAPDAFGQLAEVVEITARDVNVKGQPFICLYTRLSDTSRMSGSFTAGQLHRTTKITARHSSWELTRIEWHGGTPQA